MNRLAVFELDVNDIKLTIFNYTQSGYFAIEQQIVEPVKLKSIQKIDIEDAAQLISEGGTLSKISEPLFKISRCPFVNGSKLPG